MDQERSCHILTGETWKASLELANGGKLQQGLINLNIKDQLQIESEGLCQYFGNQALDGGIRLDRELGHGREFISFLYHLEP